MDHPHSWLQVMIADDGGAMLEWSLEMGAPGGFARRGWRPRAVVPGDGVTVTPHPLKDGSPERQLLTVALPDGTVVGEQLVWSVVNLGAKLELMLSAGSLNTKRSLNRMRLVRARRSCFSRRELAGEHLCRKQSA